MENPHRAFIRDLQHDLEHHERAAEDVRQQIVDAEDAAEQWDMLRDEAE